MAQAAGMAASDNPQAVSILATKNTVASEIGMNQRLAGKRIVVTAAAAGIGRATALAFAEAGAWVHAVDVDAENLDTLCADAPALAPHVVDLLDADAHRVVADEVGQADVLFNCVGVVHAGTILDCSEEVWDFAFDLNVKTMYRLSRAFLPGMLRARSGNIINMASVAGVSTGVPKRFVYSATKAAVAGLTRSIACDFVQEGIRCNAVCPGTVDTPSLRGRLKAFEDPEQARRDFEKRQPMGRIAEPEEIAALLVYLASDESAFVTGQTFVIDGGWSNG